MSFASLTRGREVACITQVLSIFGIVEIRQMRQLFSHLNNARYGKIIARLEREGIIYHDPGGIYLSTNRYTLDRTAVEASVRTFWAFIRLRDRVKSVCSGTAPALLSFASERSEYDMIPVGAEDLEAVAESADSLPGFVRRLLIVSDAELMDRMTYRPKHDFVMVVGPDGETELYKM